MDWTTDQILRLRQRANLALDEPFTSEARDTELAKLIRLKRSDSFNYDLLHLSLAQLGY